MHILKFGGTSMGDHETWQRVLDIISRYEKPFVIVSATARTTRQLLAASELATKNIEKAFEIADDIHTRHQELVHNFINNQANVDADITTECNMWIDTHIKELKEHLKSIHEHGQLSAQTKDTIASTGERLSSYLFAKCGTAAGFSTIWIDATDIIRTNSDFGQASPQTDFIAQQRDYLLEKVHAGDIPVMGGYYGQDENGHTTTLGFEGSDYSASLVGAALSADAIEIWTDVSGIYTCDPRLTPAAKPIAQLSFQEATELAYFGAKVLHPSTTKPASQKQIPLWVKNIFEPDEPGTEISHKTVGDGRVKAMTYKENCAIITVTSSQTVMGYEFLAGVFDILSRHYLPVDVVTTTEASVSIAIENGDRITDAIEQLKTYGSVDHSAEQGIISLVGCNPQKAESLVNDVLTDINSDTVNLLSFSRSKGNLNIVMPNEQVTTSAKTIHQKLFE